MKVKIKDRQGQFTLISIVSEEVITGETLGIKKTQIKAVAYVHDKDRKAHKFLAEHIEQYD